MPKCKFPDDWSVKEARKLAEVFRNHRVRCRIVRRKNFATYVVTTVVDEEGVQRRQDALKEAREKGIDVLYI